MESQSRLRESRHRLLHRTAGRQPGPTSGSAIHPKRSAAKAQRKAASRPIPSTDSLNPTRLSLLQTFALDAAIVRGSGHDIFDAEGRQYLDFLSQYGALPFGHNPPAVWGAIREAEAEQAPVMVQPLRPLEAERLAERLASLAPGDLHHVTLTNSGAESVEAAIKLARVQTGRDIVLSTKNGFHGKTLGALSATGKELYQTPFAAPADGFEYVPFGDLAALEARLEADADKIAAFMVEPIQGEGGVICPPRDYLDRAIQLCRKHGVLSIVDEIQTGLGRTGALFASADTAEPPDMLLLAKALGGGLFPIGACITRKEIWDDRFGLLHSSTFANNNLACRVANAVLDELERNDREVIRRVAENGAYFLGRLRALQVRYPDVVKDVRGRGYMVGVEFHRFDERDDSATMSFCSLNRGVSPLFSSYLFNVHGVLTAPLFNDSHVMRLQPPFTVGRAEIDRVMKALEALCEAVHRRDYHRVVRHLVDSSRSWTDAEEAESRGAAAPSRTVQEPHPNRFGFLIHYTEKDEIARLDESLGKFTDDELVEWRAWMTRHGPGLVRRVPHMRSKAGAEIDGWILTMTMLPSEMRGPARSRAVGLIEDAVDLAAEHGASRFGLGAFTSIATRGGEAVTGRGPGITSGNTLTTVLAVRALENVAQRVGVDIGRAHVAVVGATGAIGRLASLMLAREVGEITLVGNPANPFSPKLTRHVADEVYRALLEQGDVAPGELSLLVNGIGRRAGLTKVLSENDGSSSVAALERFEQAFQAARLRPRVHCTTDLDATLAEADLVLVATSSDVTVVDPDRLRPGTIVCDVARPQNVAQADLSRSGALVFDGGLVDPPEPIDLGPVQTLPKGMCWGCLGETMLLAFEGEAGDYSIGSKLNLRDADRIAELADKHGFEPARPQWYGRILEDEDFERAARAAEGKLLPPGRVHDRHRASAPICGAGGRRVHAAE